EKPLDRLQNEAMSVSERLTIFAHVLQGSAFLLVPAPEKATAPWTVPPEYGQHYSAEQFEPMQKALQTVANGYTKGNGLEFSIAAAKLLEALRLLSPNVYPAESQLRLEYFYNHWEGFYRAAWFYGIALVLLGVVR